MQQRELVYHTAKEVRDWAEDLANEEARDESLCGLCAIASAELWKQLHKLGVKAEIHVWTSDDDGFTSHVFVVVDDHVVDVTATQFGELQRYPVHIEHKKEAEQFEWYRSQDVFDSAKSLVRWQKRRGWVQSQIARP